MPDQYQQEGFRRLATMYAVLGATNEAMLHAADAQQLFDGVCRAAVEETRFLTAAFLVPDELAQWITVQAAAGEGADALRATRIAVSEVLAEGHGLVGEAYRNQRPAVSNDFLRDERTRHWHAAAGRVGIASGAAVPLLRAGATVGVLLFHSAQAHAFDDENTRLLDRIARNIVFALDRLALEDVRRSTENVLRDSEVRYRNILESIEDAYYEVDLRGNPVLHNGAFARLLGYSPDEVRGLDNRHRQTPEMAAVVFQAFNEVWRTGAPRRSQDWEYVHKNGSTVRVEGSVQLVRDAAGQPAGFCGILRDVTERRSMEQALRDSEERFRNILDSIEESYYEVDLKGSLVHVNAAFCRMLGYAEDEMLGQSYRNFQSPEVAHSVFAVFNEVFRSGRPAHSFDWEMICKNGQGVLGEGSVQLVRDSDGQPVGFRGMLRDVTERRRTERALRESEARFRALTALSSDWYWEQDAELRFVQMESRHRDESDIQDMLLGQSGWECCFELQAPGGWDAFRALLDEHRPFRDVIMHRMLPDQRPYYISVSGEPVFNESGAFTGYRGVSREITDQKVAEERIHYLATHDSLTQLPNRAMFSHLLNMALSSAQRYRRKFAVLFIDLDRFKFINDTLGHEAGDILLKEIAERFRQQVRSSDVLARLGGDEFVVLLNELQDETQAAAVARKILTAAIRPVTLAGQECRVTASIGIAMYPAAGDDEQSLMKNADIAMYHAKEEGKNNYQFYSKDIRAQSLERLALEAGLRGAMAKGEFSLHYQAKRDLKSGAITGVEALLRWNNPALGNVPPTQFIPIAEETGLIVQIGKWVLQTACAQNMAWQRLGLPPICMAVNLSVRQFADDFLLEDIDAILASTGMAPQLLELEVTESMVIHNPSRAIRLLSAIKERGVRIAIDDFGTGYSSLGQLKNFPIDTLKVDRSFIRELATDAGDRAITEAIIAMGKTLSMTVVAEGVETREQETYLREHACDEMQGYYFSRPVAPEEFAQLLARHAPPLPRTA